MESKSPLIKSGRKLDIRLDKEDERKRDRVRIAKKTEALYVSQRYER